ncbi:hypothetical protein BU17DRAFT_73654 [Hysterangium stoloniferum]|nr:hypothetical protein BU17DRAFT_73654 [Hysterangium stoloniferum]
MDPDEYAETTTTTLEWVVRDLKHLFEGSKGEAKSKVIKSVKFGGGKWQCLFYPNSGTDGGNYISLYLSCEPTLEEKENAVNGKWLREGLFKFSFELRSITKGVLFNTKEACDHSFSYKTANWGWSQFARRDAVYFHPNTVRSQDAFLIICTITASPTPPAPIWSEPMKSVPKDLLDAVGNLLDDPVYSDVEFVLPSRNPSLSKPKIKTIWAARRLLKRANYFQNSMVVHYAYEIALNHAMTSVFESGFAEATDQSNRLMLPYLTPKVQTNPRHFEDSDDEDENEILGDEPADHDTDIDFCDSTTDAHMAAQQESQNLENRNTEDEEMTNADATLGSKNANTKTPHPPSAHSPTSTSGHLPTASKLDSEIPGPRKTRVVVRDVAYTTYRAVLYYLYTDTIVFAPLSSSFHPPSATSTQYSPFPSSSQASLMLPPAITGDQSLGYYGNTGKEPISSYPNKALQDKKDELQLQGPKTRREWLKEWARNNPGKVMPCSAKAVYRLADKLDLRELKNRAFQHIVKSLTVTNVAYEVFSSFSATFEDVRKVQVEYFLAHWSDIRGSDAMRNVWQQIRLGRHPGFEEVWPVIAVNLEFRPRSLEGAGDDSREGGVGSGET